jgi:cellobiose phosphorylase
MPWANIISNGDYGLAVSQVGSGYSWRTHASFNRITRWDQDLVRDEWGKYLFLRDDDTGQHWSPTYQPCGRELADLRVEHGMGYSLFGGLCHEIATQLTMFVPLDAPCEVWRLHLTNQSDRPRRLSAFTYFEWLLGVAPDWHREFHRLFIDTRGDLDRRMITARKVMWDIPGGDTHWNRDWEYTAIHASSAPLAGFDGDKRAFIGPYGRLTAPMVVRTGMSQNSEGRYGDPIGSLHVALELAPGETREIVFVLGAAADEAEQRAILRYADESAAAHGLAQAQSHWDELTARLQVETSDPALNVMANGWLVYQAVSCRMWARTAYYQTGGAYGYRDQLQDSLLWLLLDLPERTRQQIHLHAAHQYQSGIVLHWWHPIAETGLKSEYSDDLVWLPFAVLKYIEETDDPRILDEVAPFYDGGEATIREHCLRAIRVALQRRSDRGLPLILQADWNDGLNAVGIHGRGESVWMAHFLYFVLCGWVDLGVLDAALDQEFRAAAADLRRAVEQHAWDGDWFIRAITDSGKILGSRTCDEGQIFLNAQTWAALSGIADEDRTRRAMEAAREQLFKPYGALLLAPAYSIPDPEIGYLSRYAPGLRENGGVYCHAACWAVLAEREVSGVDAAYAVWRSFCPARLSTENPDQYAAEPYVMPGNIGGPLSPTPGQGAWSWYTGSGQWFLRVLIEGVFGVRARRKGLEVRAALPAEWDTCRVQRRFRGATYDIVIRRDPDAQSPEMLIDGRRWEGELLPPAAAGSTLIVAITVP